MSPLVAQVKGRPAPSHPSQKTPEPAAASRPDAFTVLAKSAMLVEAASGHVLYSQNPDEKLPPASLAKLMTLYVTYDTVRSGKSKWTDEVHISKKAWETGGSKMFVELDAKVPLEELVKGIVIISGNDACIAVAEHVAGSVEVFVQQMNAMAKKLGMHNSHFDNPHGLASPQQYATAADMMLLARRYLEEFPEALKTHSTQEYTYGGIRQFNRNRLLRKDSTIDGLKTGFINEESGYHLIATAKRDDKRLIAVVLGAKNPSGREEEALKLLNHGYRNFAFVPLFPRGKVLFELPVWKGQDDLLPVMAGAEGLVVTTTENKNKIAQDKTLPNYVVAPVAKGQVVGQYLIKVGSGEPQTIPLVAAKEIPRGGFLKVFWHNIRLVGGGKILLYLLLGGLVIAAGVVGVFVALGMSNRGRRNKIRLR